MSNEYNGTALNSGCSYQTLCSYNSNSAMAPVAQSQPVGFQVVPAYGAISNDALTHGGASSCNGYFTIGGAYGKNANKCNQQYVNRACDSCNNN